MNADTLDGTAEGPIRRRRRVVHREYREPIAPPNVWPRRRTTSHWPTDVSQRPLMVAVGQIVVWFDGEQIRVGLLCNTGGE